MSTPMLSNSDGFENIVDTAGLIRLQNVSPVELVNTCLERIERLQPQLNAFITVTAETALRAAEAAENEIRQGKWKGPLHGIPVGIKDFYDTAGIRTTAAFEHFRNRVPKKDAAVVKKLKKAGAIIIGKMNMDTLGMGTTGLESHFGPVKNPWNSNYIAGGSSSGSAAAIASGMCYATVDTDAIGSCRLPAACCGVVGFKGTYGLIKLQGILGGEKPPDEAIVWLSHAGITTRSVEDTAVVLDVLAGRAGHPKPSFVTSLTQERRLRIGVADNCDAGSEVLDAFQKAVGTIRSFGYGMSSVVVPLTGFSKGLADIASDREAVARRSFNDVDVLLLPTTATTTLTVEEPGEPLALSPQNTMFANYYGLPAVSVPCGFDKNGLPLGLQVVAKPWDENAVLRLAHQFEAATGYREQHPGG